MSQKPKKIIQVPHMSSGRVGRPRGRGVPTVRYTVKPSPEIVKKQEEAKLRAEMQKEISMRFRVCSHTGYSCTLPVLAGYDYCARHILQDPAAPYRQCTFTYASGRRCPLPAKHHAAQDTVPPPQRLCFEHARAALSARHRSTAPPPALTTTETLLNSLQHYVKAERVRTTSCASAVSVVSDPADEQNSPHTTVDPFKQVDARAVNAAAWTAPLEAFSDSDSDADSVTVGRGGSMRGGVDEDLSGDEHVEYDRHPLRYASVYTAEESVCEARTALRLLQTAYMRQMGRLKCRLQADRATYLKGLRQEREQHCSINQQARKRPLSARERRQLKKLKAYASYHRKHGVDAVLARKLFHKRSKLTQTAAPRPSQGRCTFAEGGVRCETASLPAARHCLKHIMQDPQQVLYTECGERRAGIACAEPVAQVAVHGLGCRYHEPVPTYTVFVMKKDETDSDSDTNTATESADSQIETETVGDTDNLSRPLAVHM